jgi:hypothetical protein
MPRCWRKSQGAAKNCWHTWWIGADPTSPALCMLPYLQDADDTTVAADVSEAPAAEVASASTACASQGQARVTPQTADTPGAAPVLPCRHCLCRLLLTWPCSWLGTHAGIRRMVVCKSSMLPVEAAAAPCICLILGPWDQSNDQLTC